MHVPNERRTVTVRNIKTVKLCIINHISVYQQMREGGGAKRSILMITNKTLYSHDLKLQDDLNFRMKKHVYQ